MLCLVEYPELMKNPETMKLFPKDIVEKAKMFMQKNPSGTGAYTQSAGIPFVRQAVADFIRKRDGISTSRDSIILTDGASKGVQSAILTLLKNPNDGYMIPIPQYPLYSATITLYGGKQIGYYIDEIGHWQLNEGILTESISLARSSGIRPVAIAVINPGNPTGAVLSYENIRMIIEFAKKNGLAILADEVYQENIYNVNVKFHSFAKVMDDMKEATVSLFSFHSVSKGFLGECGHRGGYTEFRNIPPEVLAELVKLQSISLCANVSGQIATYLMVSPPKPGDESYETYCEERDGILRDLKDKAEILGREINAIPGMSLETPQGAMYAFVKFDLPSDPSKDVDRMMADERMAYEADRDSEYCMALLEETGICVVPGSGFGQLPGTLHFRTTFLPPKDEMKDFVSMLKKFHLAYTNKLRNSYLK
jgi:aspartate/methionine/tyrosine aminotransferase